MHQHAGSKLRLFQFFSNQRKRNARSPSILLKSALCTSGFSSAIFFRSSFAQTMNAFIGRLMRGSPRRFCCLPSVSSLGPISGFIRCWSRDCRNISYGVHEYTEAFAIAILCCCCCCIHPFGYGVCIVAAIAVWWSNVIILSALKEAEVEFQAHTGDCKCPSHLLYTYTVSSVHTNR